MRLNTRFRRISFPILENFGAGDNVLSQWRIVFPEKIYTGDNLLSDWCIEFGCSDLFRVLTDDISTRRLNEQYSSTWNHNRSQFQHFTISVLRIEWTWYKVHEGFSAQKLFCNAEFLSDMHHHQNLNQSHDIAKMVDFQENHTIYIIKYTSTYLP